MSKRHGYHWDSTKSYLTQVTHHLYGTVYDIQELDVVETKPLYIFNETTLTKTVFISIVKFRSINLTIFRWHTLYFFPQVPKKIMCNFQYLIRALLGVTVKIPSTTSRNHEIKIFGGE